jgi:hypothetical protein
VGGAHPGKKEKLIWHKSRKKSHILMRSVSLFPHLADPLWTHSYWTL